MSASRTIVVALAAFLFAGSANAEDASQKSKILSPDGQDVCFGRVYGGAHLKSHPKQKVSRVFFWYGKDPVSQPDESPPGSGNSYNGYLTTTVRNAKAPEWAGGWCYENEPGAKAQIRCGSDCDRGMASLSVDDKGRLHVTGIARDLYLDPDAEDELGKAGYEKAALGAEDDNFALDRMPAEQCKSEFGLIEPADPKLGRPLRERLKPDQPFCFGRDYDAKHMSTHPDQVTTTIRVFRGPTELASYAAINKPENWPSGAEVAVSVTTRSKSARATQLYSCQGVGDSWECAAKAGADAACGLDQRSIFLRRGATGAMMLANPAGGLPIVDLCGTDGGKATRTDDKVYRLQPMPQDACAP